MTQAEYERHKRSIEEQCRAGIELLESARQAQIRALDLVWMLHGPGEGGSAASWSEEPALSPEAPAAPSHEAPGPTVPGKRRGPDVEEDIRQSLGRLPETFTRTHVCEVLGYEPDRGALYRILQYLVEEGAVSVVSPGVGQRATVYRRIAGAGSPESA